MTDGHAQKNKYVFCFHFHNLLLTRGKKEKISLRSSCVQNFAIETVG